MNLLVQVYSHQYSAVCICTIHSITSYSIPCPLVFFGVFRGVLHLLFSCFVLGAANSCVFAAFGVELLKGRRGGWAELLGVVYSSTTASKAASRRLSMLFSSGSSASLSSHSSSESLRNSLGFIFLFENYFLNHLDDE